MRFNSPSLFVWILTLLVSTPLLAQTSLFLSVGPNGVSGDPPPGVQAIYPVEIAFDDLATAPTQLDVDLPEVGVVTVSLRAFEAKEGFDAPGVPSPGTTIDDLRYVWRGRGEEYDVIVAVAYGWPSATIVGPGGDFTLQQTVNLATQTVESHNLVRLGPLPFDEEPPMVPPPVAPAISDSRLAFQEPWKREPGEGVPAPRLWKSFGGQPEVIKVLSVFTEQARIDAGGNVINYKDTAGIASVIDCSFGEVNQAFENSLINVKFEVVVAIRLDGFLPSGDAFTDLSTLQAHPDIQQWRIDHKADLVSVLLRNGTSGTYCGYAYTQRPGCGDSDPIGTCDPGYDFQPYAFHWVAVNCARDSKTVPHEVGHNFSLEHDIESLPLGFGRDRALFSDGFGYTHDSGSTGFKTVMSADAFTPRVLFYSNPYVTYDGFPVGLINDRYAARAAQAVSWTMVGFEDLPSEILLCDGFEANDLEAWR